MASKKERNHYDLKEIENYCRTKTFPKRLAGKGEKQILVKTAEQFSIKSWQLYYKESRLVLAGKDLQVDSIYGINEGLGDTSHSKSVSAHVGRLLLLLLLLLLLF